MVLIIKNQDKVLTAVFCIPRLTILWYVVILNFEAMENRFKKNGAT